MCCEVVPFQALIGYAIAGLACVYFGSLAWMFMRPVQQSANGSGGAFLASLDVPPLDRLDSYDSMA